MTKVKKHTLPILKSGALYIDIKRIIRKDDEQVYVNTFDKFDGMVKLLEKHDLPRLIRKKKIT